MSGLNSQNTPNAQESNSQILNDIQALQALEQQMFSNLEGNNQLTQAQQESIIQNINQISTMRINLYQTLSGVNSFYQSALANTQGTLTEQEAAIDIVEQELNRAKGQLKVLQTEKNNKVRLVEINTYYGEKYAEHTQLMKIIIYTLVPVIILAVLNTKGILPNTIYYILLGIVSVIGAVFFWKTMASILTRDAMNYNEYNWYFDPDAAPSDGGSDDNPWITNKLPGTCVGEACCSDGQIWDSDLDQCTGTSTVTESFMTESMVNKVLTKGSNNKYKQDVTLNGNSSVKPMNSDSFINYRRKN